ncbi:unnamed protein product [Prorocentrum cordatum]|uniref:Uncharacterized protein n=1 Tax=Prorocentrum cordatum TaxID=2364126 RepID=A0ABN9UDG1_9DINO|nr:unnamed protein product [Polarella glacialis]
MWVRWWSRLSWSACSAAKRLRIFLNCAVICLDTYPLTFGGSMPLQGPKWGIKRTADGKRQRQLVEAGAKATTRKEKLENMVVFFAALALPQAAEVRDLIGATFYTVLLAADHGIAKAMVQAGRDYHTAAKDPKGTPKGETDLLGPPFLHVFTELVTAAHGLGALAENHKIVLGKL